MRETGTKSVVYFSLYTLQSHEQEGASGMCNKSTQSQHRGRFITLHGNTWTYNKNVYRKDIWDTVIVTVIVSYQGANKCDLIVVINEAVANIAWHFLSFRSLEMN